MTFDTAGLVCDSESLHIWRVEHTDSWAVYPCGPHMPLDVWTGQSWVQPQRKYLNMAYLHQYKRLRGYCSDRYQNLAGNGRFGTNQKFNSQYQFIWECIGSFRLWRILRCVRNHIIPSTEGYDGQKSYPLRHAERGNKYNIWKQWIADLQLHWVRVVISLIHNSKNR